MKKIDPIERALDAYFQLDESQRRVFQAAVRHVDRYAGTTSNDPVPTPTRGRPKGSRNRTRNVENESPGGAWGTSGGAEVDSLELRHNNGATTEGL